MALVKCPDCGRDVSTAATMCPQCGRPMAAVAAPAPATPVASSGKEETLWHGTPSWLLLLGKIIRAVLVAIILPVIYYFGRDFLAQYSTIVWSIIAIVILWQVVEVFIALTRIRTTMYTITTQRVILESGVFSKEVQEIDLRYIDDTQFRQSFIQRMLGIGSVVIVSKDVASHTLRGIPDPRGVRELIRSNAYQVSQRQLFTRAT
jgi:membrane protein YdbS with pleckstrin-like domain